MASINANSEPYAPFTHASFLEFSAWLKSPDHKNRWLFSIEKIAEYRNWLIFENEKPAPGPEQQKQYNQRHDAKASYLVKDGQLFRKGLVKDGIAELNRLVVCDNDVFYKIRDVHLQLGHAGMNKTFIGIKEQFYGITKAEVEWLLKHCQTCLLNRQNRSRAPLEPIISDHTMERIQIDLVDMRHEPDGQYKWILHIKDHFSKWSSLFPLKSKRAEEVAAQIAIWIGC